MKITEIKNNKKRYLDLLLLADEEEAMIDRYIDRGRMFVLTDGDVRSECIVTDEGDEVLEIKSLATYPEYQGRGYARALIEFILDRFKDSFSVLQVGTGDSPMTLPFYEKCGFVRSHVLPNFFTENYSHPIYEGGVRLVHMVYLKRSF